MPYTTGRMVLRQTYGDSDTNAYLDAVEVADGQTLEPEVRIAVVNFVDGCKNDGIWDAIKACCILAGARTLTGALVPLVGTAPTNNNFVSGDYNRETGLIGDGSTKYLDSNRNRSSEPQNSCHFAAFLTEKETLPGARFLMGAGAGTGGLGFTHMSLGGFRILRHSSQSVLVNQYVNPSIGLVGSSRKSPSSITIRHSGSSSAFNLPSDGAVNTSFLVFATTSPQANELLSARLAFYSIGEDLDLALLDNRVSTLMTDLGAAIP